MGAKRAVLFKVISLKPDHVQYKPFDVLLEPKDDLYVELLVDQADLIDDRKKDMLVVSADGIAEVALQMLKSIEQADVEFTEFKRKLWTS
jgi:hypothetical protein